MHLIPDFEIYNDGSKKTGQFKLPSIDDEIDELMMQIDDLYFEMEFTKAKKLLKKIISKNPSYVDPYFTLADIARQENRPGDDEDILRQAINYFKSGIPPDFEGEIPWAFHENRSFLRLLHELILTLDQNKRSEEAIKTAKALLEYNPNDNQGIRYLIGDLYIKNNQFKEATSYLKKNADQYPPNRYSYAFLLFKENKRWDAITQFRYGFTENIYISEMLNLKAPLIQYEIFEQSNFNGMEIASDYVMSMGEYWFQEIDVLQFMDFLIGHPTIAKEINEIYYLLHEIYTLPSSNDFIGGLGDFENENDLDLREINRETQNEIFKQIDKIKRNIDTPSSKKILKDFDEFFG